MTREVLGLNILLNASLVNGTGNVEIFVNGTLYNNGSSQQTNLTNLSVGYYNVSAIYRGGVNFTSDSEVFWVNVSVDNTNPDVTINLPLNNKV